MVSSGSEPAADPLRSRADTWVSNIRGRNWARDNLQVAKGNLGAFHFKKLNKSQTPCGLKRTRNQAKREEVARRGPGGRPEGCPRCPGTAAPRPQRFLPAPHLLFARLPLLPDGATYRKGQRLFSTLIYGISRMDLSITHAPPGAAERPGDPVTRTPGSAERPGIR